MKEIRVPLELIEPNPYQVRLAEDPGVVEAIAASIETNGLLQVPTARPSTVQRPDGKYGWQLAFGHSRFAAYTYLASQGKAEFVDMPLVMRELTDRQMFEMAVAENVQRRDLSPIEEAQAMWRATDDFKLTSAEVGVLFGMSDATVRGKMRLLDLPQQVRAQVQSGELTEGVSRSLLTAAKVLPEKRIVVMAKEMAKGGYQDASEIVGNELRLGMHEMWGRWDKDKEPRGGDQLWPLPWKHPGLPELTPGEAVKALELKIKPQQIKGLIDAANDGTDFKGDGSEDPELVQKIQLLVNPPICTECPVYVRLDGVHYCGLKSCWSRKKSAFVQQEFAKVVAATGIAEYDKAKDGPVRKSDWNSREAFKKLFKEKDEFLRLVLHLSDYHADDITGSHYAAVVDVKPKRVEAAKERKAAGQSAYSGVTPSTPQENAKQERESQLRDKAQEFCEAAIPVFAEALKGLENVAVLKELARATGTFSFPSDALPKAKRLQILRQDVTNNLMEEGDILPFDFFHKGPVIVAKHLEKVAAEWGVKLPKDWHERAQKMMPIPATHVAGTGDAGSKPARGGRKKKSKEKKKS